MAAYTAQMMVRGAYPQGAAGVVPSHSAPPGTFLPGTKVQVGNHRVVIDRYLSEGGFAHVYVVTLPKPIEGHEKAVLKRVAVPDKEHLANMRTEVETMKRLRGHKHIVKYIDSHASSLKGGGFEVFLLMEYCQGGGLIDLMNTRLQNRLTEPEILNIFTDIAEGVACMHYLKPPLLHRDLKIENVLISTSGKGKVFKLCDFGSAAVARPAATSTAEGRLIEDDIQQHTTLQYRSPEMIDVYRKQPIDEKSDIWALGCFLYKLCYYTTPFEEVGRMAILNASFKYPGYPKFSDQLKLLIATMLQEQPSQRPNIYQILQKASAMDGREMNIKDIYSAPSKSERGKTEVRSDHLIPESKPGASQGPSKLEGTQKVLDVAPMRRGRPSAPSSHHNSAKPSPSPLRIIEGSDPFAQLDGPRIAAGDELSTRFPTLDQFQLLADKKSRFAFQSDHEKPENLGEEPLSQRVTNALADDAFERPSSPAKPKQNVSAKQDTTRAATLPTKSRVLEAGDKSSISVPVLPRKPITVSGSNSIGSRSQSPSLPSISDKPIWRVPNLDRPSSTGPASKVIKTPQPSIMTSRSGTRLASLLQEDHSQSQQRIDMEQRPTSSLRLSAEPSQMDTPSNGDETSINRSRSLNIRSRPFSMNLGAEGSHIGGPEPQKSQPTVPVYRPSFEDPETAIIETDNHITSDVDFLRVKEEEEKERNRHVRRGSSKSRHIKRASLPSIALAGTKNILQGRFGEAFKKFEGGDDQRLETEEVTTTHDNNLTPIDGSEATDLSEDRNGLDETEELSPEMKRELEKRHLEAEERRVANAAAEYRQKATAGGGRPHVPSSKAASIQNRVQSLLQDSGRPVTKTASGYGQYTDTPSPVSPNGIQTSGIGQVQPLRTVAGVKSGYSQEPRSISAPVSQVSLPRLQKPIAPPKPRVLQTNRGDISILGTSNGYVGGLNNASRNANEDWEEQFSQRYPSLSHLEMVEMEIGSAGNKMSVKEI